ncbi:MAG: SpoIIE family protein phosphatase, partial [Firmicutes bacterium]|nr:SpoIIE family protein phosphatase [Bacillota bacterium]
FVSFRTRPSQLNQRLFSSLGAFGGVAYGLLLVAGALFLLIELLALRSGIRLTRSVTRTVEQLYEATQHVRRGDFSHRVLPHERDQLGVLAESFNDMTGSIASLIEEQRQRQRLENELTIAREVQAELFPRTIPKVPGLHLSAICRAARMVSGDYYDFVPMTPNHLAIVLADISGKGISAALLMASLQAALRSQLLIEGAERHSTAELVARLNLHLFRNSSEDRYATLFFAIYEAATATLRYTNAGHLPPLYVCGDRVCRLETGGMVVGLFEHCTFEQGVLTLEPGSVLVAYSDGLVEPENVYGEEFGVRRVQNEVLRQQRLPPEALAETLMVAVEEWSGAPDRADDMTVIVARRE